MPNEFLRDRILRKLDGLSDERLYQVLDYVEFLESRYAERASPPPNVLQRFAEAVEDKMRAGRVSTQTIAETMGLMNRAMGVLNGVAAAGASVAKDMRDVVDAAARPPARGEPGAAGQAAPPAPPAPTVPPGAGGTNAAPSSGRPADGTPPAGGPPPSR